MLCWVEPYPNPTLTLLLTLTLTLTLTLILPLLRTPDSQPQLLEASAPPGQGTGINMCQSRLAPLREYNGLCSAAGT